MTDMNLHVSYGGKLATEVSHANVSIYASYVPLQTNVCMSIIAN